MFGVTARHFHYLAEADLAGTVYSTSPFFHSDGASGAGLLKKKGDIFCLRPNPNPTVTVWPCEPAPLGFLSAHVPGAAGATMSTPYQSATLNLVDPGKFTGVWRRYSCACKACLQGNGACTFYGESVSGPAWEGYHVKRKVPTPKTGSDTSFMALMVDGLLPRWEGALDKFETSVGTFIKSTLHRFTTHPKAVAYVSSRFTGSQWVRKWVLSEAATHANDPLAWEGRRGEIVAKLQRWGWTAHQGSGKPRQPALEFVEELISE